MENNPAPHHTRITLEYYIHMSSEKPVTTRAIYISKLLGSQPSLFDLLNPCRRSKYALCTGWSSTLIEGVFEVPSQSVIPNPIAATAPRASTACKILFESTELVREGSIEVAVKRGVWDWGGRNRILQIWQSKLCRKSVL